MCNIQRTFVVLAFIHVAIGQDDYPPNDPDNFENSASQNSDFSGATEHPGGSVNGQVTFEKSLSPYWLRSDLIVERDATLLVEPGVTVKFDPQVGITVRGTINADVSKLTTIHIQLLESLEPNVFKLQHCKVTSDFSL